MSTAVAMAPAIGVWCVQCAPKKHYVQAVEYLREDGATKALCMFCRDNDPCPSCASYCEDPEPKEKTVAKQDKQREIYKELIQQADQHPVVKPILNHFKTTFKEVDGIEVRYLEREELQGRVRRGPKDHFYSKCRELCEASTICVEFKVPKGKRLDSFKSCLGGHLHRFSKIRFRLWQDRKTNTVLVERYEKKS